MYAIAGKRLLLSCADVPQCEWLDSNQQVTQLNVVCFPYLSYIHPYAHMANSNPRLYRLIDTSLRLILLIDRVGICTLHDIDSSQLSRPQKVQYLIV